MAEHQVRLSDLISDLLSKGWHPSLVRRELQRRGIAWSYKYQRQEGARARTRRLRQVGLKACETPDCRGTVRIKTGAALCPECLSKKWSTS